MNLNTMTTAERERLAYAEGFVETAKLFARLDDMHHALGVSLGDDLNDSHERVQELIDERDSAREERDAYYDDYIAMRAERDELRHVLNMAAEALANDTGAHEVLAYIRANAW